MHIYISHVYIDGGKSFIATFNKWIHKTETDIEINYVRV